MGRRVDLDDITDVHGVAEIIGVKRNTVAVLQGRHADMPRPVIDLGKGRCLLWLRSEVEQWARRTGRLPRS